MKTLHHFKMNSANADQTGGGSSTNSNPDQTATQTQSTETDKSVERMKELEMALEKEKKVNTQLSSKVQTLSSDIEKIRTQGLKSKEDYKTLSESLEQQVEALKGENSKLKDSIFHTTRVSAVKDEAVKLGLRSAALSDLEAMDLEEIKVNVGEDRIIRVEGAGDFAKRLKTIKPYLFETPKDPVINGGGGGGGGGGGMTGEVSRDQLTQAYIARNKSPENMAKYRTIQKQFDEQTRKARATTK